MWTTLTQTNLRSFLFFLLFWAVALFGLSLCSGCLAGPPMVELDGDVGVVVEHVLTYTETPPDHPVWATLGQPAVNPQVFYDWMRPILEEYDRRVSENAAQMQQYEYEIMVHASSVLHKYLSTLTG